MFVRCRDSLIIIVTLYTKCVSLLEELDKYSPLFYALTWHEEAAVGKRNYLPLNLAEDFPPNTLLHLAARSFKRDEMSDVLRKALAAGIINIFALRGGNNLLSFSLFFICMMIAY